MLPNPLFVNDTPLDTAPRGLLFHLRGAVLIGVNTSRWLQREKVTID
jgi:hypothetical protein